RSRRGYPSFSSSLLDAVYRSIDQGEEMRTQRSFGLARTGEEVANLQRAAMIDRWMEKKKGGGERNRRRSAVDLQSRKDDYGGGFQRPRAIRTTAAAAEGKEKEQRKGISKAMKIYGELKKAKQPISPGGRIVEILNSLFAAGNLKKNKVVADDNNPSPPKSANTSTCSSASSFSRSCLTKTPSSRGKPSASASAAAAGKRSVRFSPVSVIVDDDSSNFHRGRHLKSSDDTIRDVMLMIHKNRRLDGAPAAADDLIGKNNHPRTKIDHRIHKQEEEEEEPINDDGDDDAASCASSDLFELENLSGIGIPRYEEELPVYETAHLHTNRAIAKGLIL
ncbi:hypothetical protein M569_12008, partial [Genlisea aurea]